MSKKHLSAKEKVDRTKQYEILEAISIVKETAHTKFDETVDLAINLDEMGAGNVLHTRGLPETDRYVCLH